MVKINDIEKIKGFLNGVEAEKVYALSIVEGAQNGEFFADDDVQPTAVLFWHYCGFACISGAYSEAFLREILEYMQKPKAGHSGRLALHTTGNERLNAVMSSGGARCGERYIFRLSGKASSIDLPNSSIRVVPIDESNYDLISGRITPSFSWESEQRFLSNGFGVCVMKGNEALACAFSSAISEEYVDIGVETAEADRGKGYGKIAAAAMVHETLKRKKTPVWSCDVRNIASKNLALSVGFEIVGTHPWYVI